MNTYVALLFSLLITATAVAQPGKGAMHRPHTPPHHEALIQKLNLTEVQQTQMKKLHLDLMKKQTGLRSKIQTLKLEIQEQFLADKVDRVAIEKNLKAINDVQHQLKMNMLDHWFQVNAILTPEQQKIWKEAPSMFGMRMREGFHQSMRRLMMHRFGWNDPDEEED